MLPMRPRVHVMDLQFRGQAGLIASYLVECGEELALIETGPQSTLPSLLAQLKELGMEASRVRHVLVTHVHLDHAGAAGWWANEHGARVYAHPAALRHLADPTRLLAGAREVYGEAMDALWGTMQAVPAPQLQLLEDGARLPLGDLVLEAWDTPGHARHHHVYVLGDMAFCGDVAGMRMPGHAYISPTTAPSQFDLPAYLKSIQRLRDAEFQTLWLTHFGPVSGHSAVRIHLEDYASCLVAATTAVESDAAAGLSEVEIAAEHSRRQQHEALAKGVSEQDWRRIELANPCAMGALGILQAWRRRQL